MADILKVFGRNVRRLREAQKLSQEDLAESAQVHRTYVGMVERAEKNITLRNIEKFAKALQVPISELVERS
jgi:transcriptional regulator with XRE-family HTH domain